MNATTFGESQLRRLRWRMARANRLAAQQTTQRATASRCHGAAHPRSIEATQRLRRTERAQRGLLRMYRRTASDLTRVKRRERDGGA